MDASWKKIFQAAVTSACVLADNWRFSSKSSVPSKASLSDGKLISTSDVRPSGMRSRTDELQTVVL